MVRRNKPVYYPHIPDSPLPLMARTTRKVRFEEVDSLGIVWHGRYPSYMEDGREAFGKKYGLSYITMYKEGFMAPIVQMHIDYHNPLRFNEEFTIEAVLHWSDAVRLNFQYLITGVSGLIVATGYTVQLITNLDMEILLVRNDFMAHFCELWKGNRFNE